VRQYILTERGKLFIAVLVIFFLIQPSLILFIWALNRDAQPNEPPPQSSPNPIQVSPDSGSGGSESVDPALSGLRAFDFDNGEMTFLFTPDIQAALDDNITLMLGELLTSPVNTGDKKIAVDIPQLPDDDTAILTAAILVAFSTYEVPLHDIVFFVYRPESDAKTFEINISFR